MKERLERIQMVFLWEGGTLERKCHLVSWNHVCMCKEKGRLGIRKLDSLNKALLGKWVWRYAMGGEDTTWKN